MTVKGCLLSIPFEVFISRHVSQSIADPVASALLTTTPTYDKQQLEPSYS